MAWLPLATRDMCRDAGDAGVTVSRTTLMHHINDHSNNSSSIFSVHRYTKLDVAIVGRWVTFHLPQFLKFSAMYVFQALFPFPEVHFEIHSATGLAKSLFLSIQVVFESQIQNLNETCHCLCQFRHEYLLPFFVILH